MPWLGSCRVWGLFFSYFPISAHHINLTFTTHINFRDRSNKRSRKGNRVASTEGLGSRLSAVKWHRLVAPEQAGSPWGAAVPGSWALHTGPASCPPCWGAGSLLLPSAVCILLQLLNTYRNSLESLGKELSSGASLTHHCGFRGFMKPCWFPWEYPGIVE